MAETRFEWDPDKDVANRKKHGVSFHLAQYAFADPRRVIAMDLSHSQSEDRFYCFGSARVTVGPFLHSELTEAGTRRRL